MTVQLVYGGHSKDVRNVPCTDCIPRYRPSPEAVPFQEGLDVCSCLRRTRVGKRGLRLLEELEAFSLHASAYYDIFLTQCIGRG